MKEIIKERTKKFALRIIKLSRSIPNTPEGRVISKQILRSGTSVGANYRSACRGKSKADFISKLGIVEEETDETIYWLELLIESGLMNKELLNSLIKEANEILAIMIKSKITARNNSKI